MERVTKDSRTNEAMLPVRDVNSALALVQVIN